MLLDGTEPSVIHPDDVHAYIGQGGNAGRWLVGMDCARKLGLEWTSEPNRNL